MAMYERAPYYITAYGLACKHGFHGTEAEWLESLHGEKGEDGQNAEIQRSGNKIQGRTGPEGEWSDLFDIDELKNDVVQETVQEAKTAAENAQKAQTAAEKAKTEAETAAKSIAGDTDAAAKSAAQAETAALAASESAKSAARNATGIAQYTQRALAAAEAAEAADQSVSQTAQEALDGALLSRSWAVGATGKREDEDNNNAKYWAAKARAAAEEAVAPAVNVYNIIVEDRDTKENFAVLVENGQLVLVKMEKKLNATEMDLVDRQTGKAYGLIVSGGVLQLEEHPAEGG